MRNNERANRKKECEGKQKKRKKEGEDKFRKSVA